MLLTTMHPLVWTVLFALALCPVADASLLGWKSIFAAPGSAHLSRWQRVAWIGLAHVTWWSFLLGMIAGMVWFVGSVDWLWELREILADAPPATVPMAAVSILEGPVFVTGALLGGLFVDRPFDPVRNGDVDGPRESA